MIKKITLSLLLIIGGTTFALAQLGTLKGKAVDAKSGEGVPFAAVVINKGGNQADGTSADFDGKYTLTAITPGKYDVIVSATGYSKSRVNGVIISSNHITFQDVKLTKGIELDPVVVFDYKIKLIDKEHTTSGGTKTAEEIDKMATRDVSSIAATTGGVSKSSRSSALNFRGQRSSATATYVNGMKISGALSVPKSAIEQITVMTGGIPAKYGDAAGIINITTKSATRNFFGGLEYTSSGYKIGDQVYGLDSYGYNLLGFNLSGPLLSKKDSSGKRGKPILGFFISGELQSVLDGSPSALGNWKTKDNVLNTLRNDPLRQNPQGLGAIPKASFLDKSDFEKIKYRQNTGNKQISLNGKLDVNTGPSTTLTFGGSYLYNNSRSYIYNYSLFNSDHNPQSITASWRTFGRFTKRFKNKKDENKDGNKSSSTIKNAFFSLQVDYSHTNQTTQDPVHKDNFAQYGYLGKFTSKYRNIYDGNNTLVNYQRTAYDYEPSTLINPVLSNYTEKYYELYDDPIGHYENPIQVEQGGGLLNGQSPADIYSMWIAPGTAYNSYQKTDNNQFRMTAEASAEIKGNAITIGFEYQQNTNRAFSVAPGGLWTLGRSLINRHIEQIDKSDTIVTRDGSLPTYTFHRLYDPSSQEFFDENIRKKLGLPIDGTDYIDFDSYGPNLWELSDFSADELINSGASYINYFGFNHVGDKIKGQPTLKDYFTQKDEDGNFKRLIPAFQPIYASMYIQDKFTFKDLIFNIGLRIDRFDANQPVLKDPYSLFETKKAGDLDIPGQPSNIGDDYVVYVDDLKNPTVEEINGYRHGDDWYSATGELLSGPESLKSPSGIAPWLVDPDKDDPITDLDASGFESYTPQITVMPRISFSFPISEDALFFAHYDILTQRPKTGNRFSPLEYQYIQNFTTVTSNPNLKPQKTIDYELGFQQKLNDHSALKISAYYKELRDQIQVKKMIGAFPYDYITYENLDFGTVKGLTIGYDLRRVGNVSLKFNYTLQFAAGTGSSSTTSLNLVTAGYPNLRTLAPFSYDQRHAFVGVFNYEYADGKKYTGPVVNGKDILSRAGANVTFTGTSGTPYTRNSLIGPEQLFSGGSSQTLGSLNGSRLPWTFRFDVKVYKNFTVVWKKNEDETGKEDNSKAINLNVYLQVLNLLNNKNILAVYSATGSAEDDGYLTADRYQTSISQQYDPESFRQLYKMKLQDPNLYSLPRRIRLGVQITF